jgi:hypothetical protein
MRAGSGSVHPDVDDLVVPGEESADDLVVPAVDQYIHSCQSKITYFKFIISISRFFVLKSYDKY